MIYQVNTTLFKRNLFRQFLRYTHSDQATLKNLYPLESRNLIKVAGCEAGAFLQGLITNDVRHFEEGAKSIYAMFLNNKGRVLYETLIHKCENEQSFLLECDKNLANQLQKHLKLFKLKRKIEIADASESYRVWALVAPPSTVLDSNNHSEKHINIHKDPRLAELGYRILSPYSMDGNEVCNVIGNVVIENSERGYRCLRYKLGVCEGADELPIGTTFPLELNCDYLHGVSFHKGCYIGQELTARVHHTGVVRKRIMPLKFNGNVDKLQFDSLISDSEKPKSNIGKLKGCINNYGVGLVRIKEAMEAKTLTIGNHTVEVTKPSWWPVEAPKEKSLSKLD